jgi:hypothetical protein
VTKPHYVNEDEYIKYIKDANPCGYVYECVKCSARGLANPSTRTIHIDCGVVIDYQESSRRLLQSDCSTNLSDRYDLGII